MCSYNNILTKRKHQFHARIQKSSSKLLAPTVHCLRSPPANEVPHKPEHFSLHTLPRQAFLHDPHDAQLAMLP